MKLRLRRTVSDEEDKVQYCIELKERFWSSWKDPRKEYEALLSYFGETRDSDKYISAECIYFDEDRAKLDYKQFIRLYTQKEARLSKKDEILESIDLDSDKEKFTAAL